MRLTAVLIVKNEEQLIRKALESVKDFDEIVVVDTGSTDSTKDIAKEYTDRIFDFKWIDDFSAARNYAIKHATGDWIYSIDADQRLLSHVNEVRSEAERAESEGHKSALVKTEALGGHVHWREVLFKNDPDVFWKGAYHESLSVLSTFKSNVRRYRGSSKSKSSDPDRGLRILSKQEKTPRVMFYLGREHFERQHYDEAIEWMSRYLDEGKWIPEVGEAWFVIAKSHWHSQRGDEARGACLQAIKMNPDFKEALLLMADMHYEPWKHKWLRLAEAATSEDVLFVRV